FLIIRVVPPLSTLFPYTTLFRSHYAVAGDKYGSYFGSFHQSIPHGSHGGRCSWPRNIAGWKDDLIGPALRYRAEYALPRLGEKRDRKSTRLNSSHDQISYAVFCL